MSLREDLERVLKTTPFSIVRVVREDGSVIEVVLEQVAITDPTILVERPPLFEGQVDDEVLARFFAKKEKANDNDK